MSVSFSRQDSEMLRPPNHRREIDVPAPWLRMALHAGEPDFFDRLLALLIEESGARGGGVWLLVRAGAGSRLNLKARVGIPQGDPAWDAWLGGRMKELMAGRKVLSVQSGPAECLDWASGGPFVFVPLVWEGAGFGVALLNAPAVTLASAGNLGVLAGWAMRLHVRNPHGTRAGSEQACTEALLASAQSADWPGVLAAHLRRESGAWRASLLRERKGRWRVVAVSGAGEVKRRTAESRAIEEGFARSVASASNGNESVHRERNVVSIRFGKASGWGSLLEFEKGHTPKEAQVLKGLAGLIAVGERVLPQVHDHGWRLSVSRALLDRSRAAGPRGSRWAAAGFVLLLVLAMFVPVTENFEGECELQPAQRATIVAEVEGRVQTVAVEEGALVAAGQTIATLENSALKTRLEVVRELRQEKEAEARRFQGLQDMTSYRLAKLKAEQNAQEEASLLEDIRRSNMVSPIAGKVLTKDLPQRQGTVLRFGEVLCEVGGLTAWNLQIALPEEDLDALSRALVEKGKLRVSYRLKADSTIAIEAEITSVRQLSQMIYPVDGRNVVYITTLGVALPPELLRDLRPGFSGRAKIEGIKRSWGLILTRRARQFARLHWWL